MRTDDTYILTFTGRKCWPLDPRPEDIDIVDIAHALSQICRFTGHTREFYSVAQHSTIVAQALLDRGEPPRTALYGLLHDASEAYICDVSRPVKRQAMMYAYRQAEHILQTCIYETFGLGSQPLCVDNVDTQLLAAELCDLMTGPDDQVLREIADTLLGRVVPCDSRDAERAFLGLFYDLTTANEAARV